MANNPPQYYIPKPIFQGQANGLIECQAEGCSWDFAGPRDVLKEAWNQHYRINHSEEIGVVHIHKKLRAEIWLPTSR